MTSATLRQDFIPLQSVLIPGSQVITHFGAEGRYRTRFWDMAVDNTTIICYNYERFHHLTDQWWATSIILKDLLVRLDITPANVVKHMADLHGSAYTAFNPHQGRIL